MQKIGRKRQNRIQWEALADEAVRLNFAENVDQRFSRLPPKEADVETEWSPFRTSILGAATEMCGVKRIGPSIGQKRTPWWNDEVRAVVAEKKAAYRSRISRQTAETWQKYLQTRDKTKEIIAKAKSTSWEKTCPMIYSPLEICYLAKGTSLIDGKDILWNSTTQLHEGGEHRTNLNGTRLVTSLRTRFRQL